MIYLVGFISGIINGVFASGAGQILIFYLIFIKKIDSYLGRAISMLVLIFASIITLINYFEFVNIDIKTLIYVIPISIIFGIIGNKIMFKINQNFLNLLSGFVLLILSIYGMVKWYDIYYNSNS